MKPLIGITAGEIKNITEPWSPTTYGQRHTYSDAVIQAGGLPVILPLTSNRQVLTALYAKLDGILFAGGDDFNPRLYGEKLGTAKCNISDFRDSVELLLMNLCRVERKPVLGICRGMQLLNIIHGGSLYQYIPTALPDAQNHQGSTDAKSITHIAHHLRLAQDSKLASLVGSEPLKANSHHHQAIKRVGQDLRVSAWAEDGIIEAIEQPGAAFVIGVQSHPESLAAVAEPRWQHLFNAFVTASQPQAKSAVRRKPELQAAAYSDVSALS